MLSDTKCSAFLTVVVLMSGLSLADRPSEQAPVIEFRLADTTPSDIFKRPAKLDSGVEFYLHEDALLTVDDIAAVKFIRRPGRVTALHLEFESEGVKRLATATQQNVGKRLAVVLDGKVVFAPTILEQISTKANLTGDFSDQTLSRLFAALVLAKPHPQNTEPLAPILEAAQPLNINP